MSFLRWFFGKSRQTQHAAMSRDKLPLTRPQRLTPEAGSREDEHKTKNHSGREQLYIAIREAMTRAGILSASYKFKVLSLDKRVNNFLVMIDLTRAAGDPVFQPGEMEALIVQSARIRYHIMVSAVYWRLNEVAAAGKTPPPVIVAAVARSAKESSASHEPIQADEVVAFQQALLAASAHGPAVVLEKNVKVSSGLRFSAQLADFEDTEIVEPASYPVLSNTQYGDLH